ncbi:Nuclear speckle splicing regulatory protein 1 [Coccomyxa sp. Obi]|nr:Nuclear speckle splicing regulatory protein 1 [Coccomyxa sp. Obi]
MLTGLKGVKYGLQPGAKQKAKPVLQKQANVFGDDDDEEGNVGQDIARHAAKKQADKKVTQMHAAALAEDASVFDYDGVYESIQEARVQPRQQEKLARKSRYIEGLLEKAKEREREQDIIYERTLLKERAAEDHLFGDKDKFVTAAYKKKLEEDQKWLAAERIREARDAKADVVKAGHMGNFYRNIMSGNVAFGTAAPSAPIPERPPAASEAPSESEPGSAPDHTFEAARRAREAYEAARDRGAAAAPAGSGQAAAAASDRPSASANPQDGVGEQTRRGAEPRESGGEKDSGAAAANAPRRDEKGRDAAPANASADVGKKESVAAAAPVAKATEEDKAMKAAAARERFLARKRKAPDAA